MVQNRNPMSHRCRDCRKYFSVRTGTALARSRLPLRKWVIAIHLCTASTEGTSSAEIRHSLAVTEETALSLANCIRGAFEDGDTQPVDRINVITEAN